MLLLPGMLPKSLKAIYSKGYDSPTGRHIEKKARFLTGLFFVYLPLNSYIDKGFQANWSPFSVEHLRTLKPFKREFQTGFCCLGLLPKISYTPR